MNLAEPPDSVQTTRWPPRNPTCREPVLGTTTTITAAETQAPTGYLELIRENADFRALWLGQIVSLLGDWFNMVASAALVAKLTGSELAVECFRPRRRWLVGPLGVAFRRAGGTHLRGRSDLLGDVLILPAHALGTGTVRANCGVRR